MNKQLDWAARLAVRVREEQDKLDTRYGRNVDMGVSGLATVLRSSPEVRELVSILRTYRASHNVCVAGAPQGLCNKCRIADAALAPFEED